MQKNLLRYIKMWTAASLLAGLAACGGGGGGTEASNGTLRLALTDAPSCGFDSVNVTIDRVRVHASSSVGPDDGGWSEVRLATPRRIDLLSLTNGVLTEIGQTPLPAGKYTQLRLVLAPNTSSNPLANSVKLTGGSEVPLDTPSGQQSGLKTNINIDIAANQLADFVLDFDACKSVVVAGNSGKYNLKPVVSVIPRLISGVEGFVAAGLANTNTTVSIQQNGVTLKTTPPDSTGRFLLQPVVPGVYTVVVAAPGAATSVVTNVPVNTALVTALNTAATALTPPTASNGTLNGTVSTASSPIDALVSVSQPLTAGGSIGLVSRQVNTINGEYSYLVATAAPRIASYVAAPAALAFSADSGAAGKFVLKAESAGVVKTSPTLSLAAGGTTTTNFSFP